MSYKTWLISGVVIFVLSMLSGTAVMLWWIWDVTQNPARTPIVTDEGFFQMPSATYAVALALFGCAIGTVLIGVGAFKGYKVSKSKIRS